MTQKVRIGSLTLFQPLEKLTGARGVACYGFFRYETGDRGHPLGGRWSRRIVIMAKRGGVIAGTGSGWNLPLLLTSIGMAVGLFFVSHAGMLHH